MERLADLALAGHPDFAPLLKMRDSATPLSREPVCLLPSLFLLLGPWQHRGGGPQPHPLCSESPSELRAGRDPSLPAQKLGFPFLASAGSGASCISWSSDVSCSRPVALGGGDFAPQGMFGRVW